MSDDQKDAIPIVVVAGPQISTEKYARFTTLEKRPKFIFFGDSITELGSDTTEGWVTSMSIRYNRRADVLNRGLKGYNSRWGRAALPLILEDVFGASGGGESGGGDNHNTTEETPTDDLFVIAFGANDSCLLTGRVARHHVPLEEYGSNLATMVEMIHTIRPSCRVALATPPPCDTVRNNGARDNDVTAKYAEEVRKVAGRLGVVCIDLWNGIQGVGGAAAEGEGSDGDGGEEETDAEAAARTAGYAAGSGGISPKVAARQKARREARQKARQDDGTPPDPPTDPNGNVDWKKAYLSDGVHLTPAGNAKVYQLVLKLLETSREDGGLGLAGADIPRQYPFHNMVDTHHPEKTFGTTTNASSQSCAEGDGEEQAAEAAARAAGYAAGAGGLTPAVAARQKARREARQAAASLDAEK